MCNVLHKIIRKIKKAHKVGLRECVRIIVNRMIAQRFTRRNKQAALAKKASTTWDMFTTTYPNFIATQDLFFKDSLIEHIDRQDIIACADAALKNNIKLFEQEIEFEGERRWHTDFLLKQERAFDCSFDPLVYFGDVIIAAGTTQDRIKDIRVVWELSRLHVLMPLGKAYALTQDVSYAQCFQALVLDWFEQNPYLLGVNWVCPMEVGIRAINLIFAYYYFKDAHIDPVFWQRYVCVLYDHMRYLEHTWEYYDGRTSNHYLSDLVGYFYLNYFFKSLYGSQTKNDWVIQEILSECEKQVAADGMSYEGSTAYHVLVTELFSLFILLCEQENIHLPQTFYQKFERMCYAIKICKINDHKMITIGDNDSGKVLWPGIFVDRVKKTPAKMPQERTDFKQFGLTIIKKDGWQLSLRQHSYVSNQPSGHFHNDVGSLTLALNEIPILVDPGSYCYTASTFWRNYFRSASVHNAASLKGREPIIFDERMFALNIPESDNSRIRSEENISVLNPLYEQYGLNFERQVKVEKNIVKIKDVALRSSPELEDFFLLFNFTFAPDIFLEKNTNRWLILRENTPVCIFESDLIFQKKPAWVSHNYGTKIPAFCLQAEVEIGVNEIHHCFLLIDCNV